MSLNNSHFIYELNIFLQQYVETNFSKFHCRRIGPNGGISLENSIKIREKLVKVRETVAILAGINFCVKSAKLMQMKSTFRRSQVSQVIAQNDVFDSNNYHHKNFNIRRLRSPNLPPIEKTMVR